MTGTSRLILGGSTEIDAERLDCLVEEMGRLAAERMIGRAIEEIDWRLMDARIALRSGDRAGLRNAMRHMVPVANTVGLPDVSRVAGDVAGAAASGDSIALSATFARLERLCDGVVPAIGEAWAAQS